MAKTAKPAVKKPTTKKPAQHCPFCEVELFEMNLPVCQACHVAIVYCEECGNPIPKNRKSCPTCGPKKAKAKA